MASTRSSAAPEIPSVDEAGLPGFYMSIWHGLWAPKGTPKDVVGRLSKAVVKSLSDAAVQKRLADIGQEIAPMAQQSPEGLAVYHKSEIEKWWPLIKAANIKSE